MNFCSSLLFISKLLGGVTRPLRIYLLASWCSPQPIVNGLLPVLCLPLFHSNCLCQCDRQIRDCALQSTPLFSVLIFLNLPARALQTLLNPFILSPFQLVVWHAHINLWLLHLLPGFSISFSCLSNSFSAHLLNVVLSQFLFYFPLSSWSHLSP